MSPELQEKLRFILRDKLSYGHLSATYHGRRNEQDRVINEIDAAYREAGWLTPSSIETLNNADIQPVRVADYVGNGNFVDRMTGQEWYERFEKEFEAMIRQDDPEDANYTLDDITYLDDFGANDILEAAKRAAGLDND